MKLIDWRKNQGLKREELARLIEVKNGRTVQRYEEGRVPAGRIMVRIETVTKGAVRLPDFVGA